FEGASNKLAMLEAIVHIPILDEGFEIMVNSAIISSSKSSISVSITLSNSYNYNNNTKNINYIISGFKVWTIEKEAEKFLTSITKDPNQNAIQASRDIETESNHEAKLSILESFANVPILENGFEFEIKKASVNIYKNTSVDVFITITETGTTNSMDFIYLISGLRESSVEIEAESFSPIGTTNLEGIPASEWVKRINNTDDFIVRLNFLKELLPVYYDGEVQEGKYHIPTLRDGFDFKILSAKLNSNYTTIEVKILVFETLDPEISFETIFAIQNFEESGPFAEAKYYFNQPTSTSNNNYSKEELLAQIAEIDANKEIDENTQNELKLEILRSLVRDNVEITNKLDDER
ncbi:MAG: hypothetical protein ACRC63_02725, partial [Metamycoplasmataceae bacterium]